VTDSQDHVTLGSKYLPVGRFVVLCAPLLSAFEAIDWNGYQQVFTDTMMKELAEACLESEIIELIRMYGSPKELQTVFNMYFLRYGWIHGDPNTFWNFFF
jgi:hypothetical protein